MTQATYDVLGVGNAIVDILAQTDEAFLESHGMAKGGMTLVDEAKAHAIYDAMGAAVEASGGSAANTIAGVASFGGKAAFIGRVRDDEFGAELDAVAAQYVLAKMAVAHARQAERDAGEVASAGDPFSANGAGRS